MIAVLKNTWALLIGVLLLMLGNGMQTTLLGVRGAAEFESTTTMSWIMSGYFVGFLGGSRLAPELIRRVGHVRVFAALGSLISAALVLFAAFSNPIVWLLLRVVVGFCFSGVYVVAESWLNDKSTNNTRGTALSAYMIVQMLGIVAAQGMLNLGDPNGYFLFVIASVLVSISFAPILLSVSPAPVCESASPMSLRELIRFSPLGAFGAFCVGGLFGAIFAMGAVYGTEAGLSLGQISVFIACIYLGGLTCQFPIGWLSDRVDRRQLILWTAVVCSAVTGAAILYADQYPVLLAVAFVMGGIINPLYSLIIAYTNDMLDPANMASGAGCMIFIGGVGAIGGPLVAGAMMVQFGPNGFFGYISLGTALLALFTVFRMAVRTSAPIDQPAAFTPVSQACSPVAVDMAQEYALDLQEAESMPDESD